MEFRRRRSDRLHFERRCHTNNSGAKAQQSENCAASNTVERHQPARTQCESSSDALCLPVPPPASRSNHIANRAAVERKAFRTAAAFLIENLRDR
jgi:hypothetical protein